jgi:hypothetical protein
LIFYEFAHNLPILQEETDMRGEDQNQQAMFSYVSPEARIPKDHPLRPIRIMVDNALNDLAPLFREMYSHTGRPSIPPEQLLRASLLQVLYSIRSERMLVEQLDYNRVSCKSLDLTRLRVDETGQGSI